MKRLLSITCIILLIILGIVCKDNPVMLPIDSISTISVKEVSCTEASVAISLSGTTLPSRVTLKRNDSAIAVLTMARKDTVFVDTQLQPGRTYTYTMLWSLNKRQVEARTQDTTSHLFSFSTYRIPGEGGPNHLWDVAAISDTDIWAVGDIYTAPDVRYNAIHWNGKTWEMKQISTPAYGGFEYPFTLRAVYAFASNDVWVFSQYQGSAHWDGVKWNTKFLDESAGLRFWGRSPSDIYLVGSLGTIVHHDGTSWKKEESGTSFDLTDVWGSPDGKSVWACGWTSDGGKSILLEKSGGRWRTVFQYQFANTLPPASKDSLRGVITSVWSDRNTDYLVAGDYGIYRVKPNSHGEAKFLWTAERRMGLLCAIRGWAGNDVLAAGEAGTLAHFNGVSWHLYDELFDPTASVQYRAVALLKDKFIAVGFAADSFFSSAIILTGAR